MGRTAAETLSEPRSFDDLLIMTVTAAVSAAGLLAVALVAAFHPDGMQARPWLGTVAFVLAIAATPLVIWGVYGAWRGAVAAARLGFGAGMRLLARR